ncbi:hypothetical protein AWI08_04140 [Klebsiella aerogenes]|nr:hypothetical protein AWI08_04140 [Klebsiella aerogenes]
MLDGGKLINKNDREVFDAVTLITKNRSGNSGESSVWIRTRDIAEYCDITIYRARYSLIKLEKNGDVVHKSTGKRMALSWRLAGKLSSK